MLNKLKIELAPLSCSRVKFESGTNVMMGPLRSLGLFPSSRVMEALKMWAHYRSLAHNNGGASVMVRDRFPLHSSFLSSPAVSYPHFKNATYGIEYDNHYSLAE